MNTYLYQRVGQKLLRDPVAIAALLTIFGFVAVALSVHFLGVAEGWDNLGESFLPPSRAHWFGTNRNGQDIFKRVLCGTRIAVELGFSVAVVATILGSFLGAIAGLSIGSLLDRLIVWLYGCLDTVPFFLLAAAVSGKGFFYPVFLIMIATFWTSTAKIVRSEVIRMREMGFVEAARSVGLTHSRIVAVHLFPNLVHLILAQATLCFVTAVKSEVILSFLGFGVRHDVSWGMMLSEASSDALAGEFGNLFAATSFFFTLILALNLMSERLGAAFHRRAPS